MQNPVIHEGVPAEGDRDIDVFALVGEPGEFAVSVMIIRGGGSNFSFLPERGDGTPTRIVHTLAPSFSVGA